MVIICFESNVRHVANNVPKGAPSCKCRVGLSCLIQQLKALHEVIHPPRLWHLLLMKRARTEGRKGQNYDTKKFYWAKTYLYEDVAQLLWLNVKAQEYLSGLCVCLCVCVWARERREKAKHMWMKKGEKCKRQTEARERKNEWCQWWMELIEFEWSVFHRSSHPLYSFRSPNHFILPFYNGSHLNLFHFLSCSRSNTDEYYMLHFYSGQNTKTPLLFLTVTEDI